MPECIQSETDVEFRQRLYSVAKTTEGEDEAEETESEEERKIELIKQKRKEKLQKRQSMRETH